MSGGYIYILANHTGTLDSDAAQQLLRASLGGIASPECQVSSQPKVTSETITGDLRKASPWPNPIPPRDILLEDDFGSRRTLASPLAGRQLPVVSAYTRAKDSFPTVRCPTRSLSQIRQSKHPAAAGFFYEPHRASKRSGNLCP
jgi:hypothetical protein